MFSNVSWYFTKEDFKQEAFMVLYKTLSSIKNDRIHTPQTWKLYDYYKWNLYSHARQIKLKIKTVLRYNIQIEDSFLEAIETSQSCDFKIMSDHFLNSLTDREKIIFYHKNLSENPKTLKELSALLNISTSFLSKINQKLISKFQNYYL